MTYKVDLLDRVTLTKTKEIEVVNEPTIHEEINGSFTFEFEAHYTAKNDLTDNVIIAVDGKYFKIAKVVKSRNDSISLNVHCEHVSYELIVDYEIDEDMEFESDVRTMIERFLSGTRFRLVDCIDTGIKYYATKTLDIRKRLFEVANLFAGELVFDNYNVSLVQQRGSNKGLEIELGVNLIGVTEEKNFVDGITSYELDLLDLSNVAGYEMDFSNVEIGDTITIKDNVLGINTTERVLAIDYNPFKKALPTVTVGDYIRDLTEYLKPEPEEDDEETEEKGVKSFFKQFKIGGVDMLQISSDEADSVREYLTNKYSLGVEVSTTYNTLKKELKGIVAEKADGVSGVLSVVQTKVNESGLMVTTITEIDTASQLSEVVIKDVEHITLVISDRSLSYYRENRENAEAAEVKAIGICVTFNDDAGVFLEKFNVGKLSMLGAENLDVTDSLLEFIDGNFNPNEHSLGAINEIDEQLKGLEIVPSEDYLDWYLTLIHVYNYGDNEDDWNLEIHDLPIENYANFKVTNHTKDFVVVIISNEPYEDVLYGTASEDAYFKAFGGTFIMEEPPAEIGGASDYLSEFRIGDVDMLPIASDETEQFKSWKQGNIQHVIPSSTYEIEGTLTGVFAQLKEEYSDYYLSFVNYYHTGSNFDTFFATFEDNSWINETTVPYENGIEAFTIVITEVPIAEITSDNVSEHFIKAFGVLVTNEEYEEYEEDGGNDADGTIYLEFGSFPVSTNMFFEFERGPYKEIGSLTTGFTISPEHWGTPSQLSTDVIFYPVYNNGYVVGVEGTSNAEVEGLLINLQVVCIVGEPEIIV